MSTEGPLSTERHTATDRSERGSPVVVGRIVAPHGVSGEVKVEVRTDEPEQRFAAGAVLGTDSSAAEPLLVETSRWHGSRLLLRFAGRTDRSAVEPLRGTLLVVDAAELPPSEDEDEFRDHELVDLAVVTLAGTYTGTVADVVHLPGQDVLAVQPPGGGEILVPFVSAIVRAVDPSGGRIMVDPPPGLMEAG